MDSVHVLSLGRPTTKMGLDGSFSGESNLKGAFGDMPKTSSTLQHTAADFNVEYCHHEYLFCTSHHTFLHPFFISDAAIRQDEEQLVPGRYENSS